MSDPLLPTDPTADQLAEYKQEIEDKSHAILAYYQRQYRAVSVMWSCLAFIIGLAVGYYLQ